MDGRSMNSLEVSRTTPSLLDGAPSPSSGKPTPAADGNFLSLLAAAGAEGSAGKTAAAEAAAKKATASGQTPPASLDTAGRDLPKPGKNGKFLPVRLPAVAAVADFPHTGSIGFDRGLTARSAARAKGEGPARSPRQATSGADGAVDEQMAAATLASPSLALSIMPPVPTAADRAASATAEGDAAATQAFADRAAPGDSFLARSAVSKEGLKPQTAEAPPSRTVAVHFAEASTQSPPLSDQIEDAGSAKAARALDARADVALQRIEAPAIVSSTPTPMPIHAAPVPVETGIARGPILAAAVTSDPAQDLTQIVDRLAAAREALAPATTALAVNHAEFGELSLRFDQQRDGHLAVHIAASNPEAQRAMAVAAGQQPSFGSPDNRSAGGEPLPQSHARDSAASRDGASHGGGDARGEPQQRRASSQNGPPDEPDRQGRGIFA